MPVKEYDEDRNDTYVEDDYYQDSDELEQEDSYEEEEDELYTEEENIFGDDCVPKREWSILKLGDLKIRVSNEGIITYLDNIFFSTKGYRDQGTPFRYVSLEVFKGDFRKYYVHDLVWRAFNYEDPPIGWAVRHSNNTPLDDDKCYENHLDYLDVYYNDVDTEFKMFKMI